VTKIGGSYVEGFGSTESKEVKENSFLVVNLKKDLGFFKNITALGILYCQDSVFLKKKGKTPYLLGTNYTKFPGYNSVHILGKYGPGKEAAFMSRIKGRPFNFDSLCIDFCDAICKDEFKLLVWDSLQVNSKKVVQDIGGEIIKYIEDGKVNS
jgi:hypothetical protein